MKIKDIILVVIFFTGICVFLYPVAMKIRFAFDTDKIIQYYTEIKPDDRGRLYQELVSYNTHLYETHQSALKDPWSYKQKGFDLRNYGYDSDIIAIIDICTIDVRLPVYMGANEANMEKGIALLTHTSMPVGGKNTNAVLCGHRGTMKAAMFRDIHKLKIDDTIKIHNFRNTLTYKVKQKTVIQPNEVNKVLIQDGRDMITLVSCEGVNDSLRYIVYCERKMNDLGLKDRE